METPDQNLSQQARAYFLQQGKTIQELYSILGSRLVTHHLRKWSSILLQLLCYAVFVTGLVIIVGMKQLLTDKNGVAPPDAVVQFCQILVGFFTVPAPIFAMLISRIRKKNNLIREAFLTTEKMKQAFDKAVKELKF